MQSLGSNNAAVCEPPSPQSYCDEAALDIQVISALAQGGVTTYWTIPGDINWVQVGVRLPVCCLCVACVLCGCLLWPRRLSACANLVGERSDSCHAHTPRLRHGISILAHVYGVMLVLYVGWCGLGALDGRARRCVGGGGVWWWRWW